MERASNPGTQRRIRRSREEWQALVARFQDSGQTPEQFCAELGIGQSTLRRWCSRLQERPPEVVTQAPVFVPLTSEERRHAVSAQSWEVELQLDTGVVLRLRRGGC
jgi:putative transposase